MALRRSSKVELLQGVRLFEGLARRQLERVATLVDEVEVPEGKRIATAGETGHHLYIVAEGTVIVTTAQGRKKRLGPGEFFGEMSLLDGGPRSATVEAATPSVRLLVVGHREFWQLLTEDPHLTRHLMRALSNRLRDAERSVTA